MAKNDFLSIKEASEWASHYLGKEVTESNISYLIQYGKILRYNENGELKENSNGRTRVSSDALKKYYASQKKEQKWKERLGDVNWKLSFDKIPERETTKHVHRLHQYKGKFIPQLVEYFLDSHKNDFKKKVFFKQGDVILDPFVGSGTTLVQCLELDLHSIGIDISSFNCAISEVKTQNYDLKKLKKELRAALKNTEVFSIKKYGNKKRLTSNKIISELNANFYPNPQFKILIAFLHHFQSKARKEIKKLQEIENIENKVAAKRIFLENNLDEKIQTELRLNNFLKKTLTTFRYVISEENIEKIVSDFSNKYEKIVLEKFDAFKKSQSSKQTKVISIENSETFNNSDFMSSWFNLRQRNEINHYINQIENQKDQAIKKVMQIVLSRTARSCRATKHVDLATLIEPQITPYYCRKHYKICNPVETILRHLKRYTNDTVKRISDFSKLKKDRYCEIINGDSRTVNIFKCIQEKNLEFYNILKKQKIAGIFSSPPYVGQIDYHEQHAYSYEMFDINRKDDFEIGKKTKGKSKGAQLDYINGISAVLKNVKKFLKEDATIFIVANDKLNLYPEIAKKSGLHIAEIYRRPVLNRTERDNQPYSESIFQMEINPD